MWLVTTVMQMTVMMVDRIIRIVIIRIIMIIMTIMIRSPPPIVIPIIIIRRVEVRRIIRVVWIAVAKSYRYSVRIT